MKNWKNWMKAAGVRAIKNGGTDRSGHHRHQRHAGPSADWIMVASASALAGLLSLLY